MLIVCLVVIALVLSSCLGGWVCGGLLWLSWFSVLAGCLRFLFLWVSDLFSRCVSGVVDVAYVLTSWVCGVVVVVWLIVFDFWLGWVTVRF